MVGRELQRGGVHHRRERFLLPGGQRRNPLRLQPAVLRRVPRLLLLRRRRCRWGRFNQPRAASCECLQAADAGTM